MVRRLPYPGARGEDMGDIAFPLGRIRTSSEASHRGRVEHRLNAAPHSARCFWLLCPDRVENLDYEPGVDRGNRQFPQNRVDVSGEGIPPLLAVLGVAPPTSLRAMNSSATSRKARPWAAESRCACRWASFASSGSIPSWRNLRCSVALPRASVGSEPHVAALAVQLEPKNPRFCTLSRHAEIKPAAVVQHGWSLRLRNLDR